MYLRIICNDEVQLVITETDEVTVTTSFVSSGSTSYFHMYKLNDNDIIMLVDDDTDQDFANTNLNVEWGLQNEYDTASFTHSTSTNSDEITLDQTGFYHISYGAQVTGADTVLRAAVLATLQLDPLGGGSFADIEYGRSYGYMRSDTAGNTFAFSGATLIEATATDKIRLNIEEVADSTTTSKQITANTGHLDIEYLGTSLDALRLHDTAGASEPMDDSGTRILGFDSSDENGNAFANSPDATDTRVTIDTTGQYYLAYSSEDDRGGTENVRTEYTVDVFVDAVEYVGCQGHTYTRGQETNQGSMFDSSAGFSCLLELTATDIVDLRVTGTGADASPDIDAVADASSFVMYLLEGTGGSSIDGNHTAIYVARSF